MRIVEGGKRKGERAKEDRRRMRKRIGVEEGRRINGRRIWQNKRGRGKRDCEEWERKNDEKTKKEGHEERTEDVVEKEKRTGRR
jgi:hypothetical protein